MPTCIIPTASPAASAVVAEASTTSSSAALNLRQPHFHSLSSFPNLRLFTKNTWQSMRTSLSGAVVVRAQINDDLKNGKPSIESVPKPLASEESISEFITQVSSLVKLVDSRDIVELQLKQLDCEILIRKKEAIIQASTPPVAMMQAPAQPAAVISSVSAPVSAPSAAPPAPQSVLKPTKSSVPPLKSPMAGTFYRSPAPNAPPFVKVGDKVQKGQVVCIIEAMKLMNEIEADQSGTVVEVIAEDGKPVSLDSPLFVIQP